MVNDAINDIGASIVPGWSMLGEMDDYATGKKKLFDIPWADNIVQIIAQFLSYISQALFGFIRWGMSQIMPDSNKAEQGMLQRVEAQTGAFVAIAQQFGLGNDFAKALQQTVNESISNYVNGMLGKDPQHALKSMTTLYVNVQNVALEALTARYAAVQKHNQQPITEEGLAALEMQAATIAQTVVGIPASTLSSKNALLRLNTAPPTTGVGGMVWGLMTLPKAVNPVDVERGTFDPRHIPALQFAMPQPAAPATGAPGNVQPASAAALPPTVSGGIPVNANAVSAPPATAPKPQSTGILGMFGF